MSLIVLSSSLFSQHQSITELHSKPIAFICGNAQAQL